MFYSCVACKYLLRLQTSWHLDLLPMLPELKGGSRLLNYWVACLFGILCLEELSGTGNCSSANFGKGTSVHLDFGTCNWMLIGKDCSLDIIYLWGSWNWKCLNIDIRPRRFVQYGNVVVSLVYPSWQILQIVYIWIRTFHLALLCLKTRTWCSSYML